jgi:hypothetical protein
MRFLLMALCALIALGIVGCSTDKAKPKYEECLKLERDGFPGRALPVCREAAQEDPESTYGKKATEKADEIAVKLVQAETKEQQDKANASQAQEQARQDAVRRVAQLRGKIKRMRMSSLDGRCAGEGMPPMGYSYEGGTYEEDGIIARADGCVIRGSYDPTYFCCPP